MQVHLTFSNNESSSFLIKSNNQKIFIDPLSTQVSIDLIQNEANIIEIVQQCPNRHTIFSWIGWILTLPLQGLFNALMTYGEDIWYKQINPYLIVAELAITPTDDSDINITFTESKYNQWISTNIECAKANAININRLPHPSGIYASYIGYVKKIVSISSIGIALFTFLLCQMIAISNTVAILICVILIIFFVGLDVLLAITQYHKAQKLYGYFIQNYF